MAKKPENKPSRQVSDEERELFRQAMQGTRPLKHDKVEPYRPTPAPRVRQTEADVDNVQADGLSDEMELETVEMGDELSFARNGIQHNTLRKLRKGQIPIEDELDLHGLRSDEAREALVRFLNSAQQRGLRCVRIIHGKGHSSPTRQPVLKNRVNSWLRQRGEVLAFCSARPADGGTGAVLLLLKR